MPKHTFSAIWSAPLGDAIRAQAEQDANPYPFKLHGDDAQAVMDAVNEGIDAYLEACYLPSRGDTYYVSGNTIQAQVSPESLPVLVRRLMEQEGDTGLSIASGICQTLDIELI